MNHSHEGFQNLTNVDVALARFLQSVRKSGAQTEWALVAQASVRVLAEDVVAKLEIPNSDRSVVDGFAVKSVDTQVASDRNILVLRVAGESRLGKPCTGTVRNGCAFAIATGSIVPKGADCVLPVEDVRRLTRHKIAVSNPAKPGENLLRKGEDLTRGKVVLTRGRLLRAEDLGVLKILGIKRVRVVRKPRVAILSTGNELVDSQQSKLSSQIVDINRLVLSAKVKQFGGMPIDYGIVKDRKELIIETLREAVKIADMVLVSGGSSVGPKDLVPSCVNAAGKPGMLVHGVAMRPAMPTGLASVSGVPVISLPGFPVSATFAFLIFGRPMMTKLSGAKSVPEAKLQARTLEGVKGVKGYRTFIRVVLKKSDEGFTARPIYSQRASVMMSLVAADGYVVVPEKSGLIPKGRLVDVTLLT